MKTQIYKTNKTNIYAKEIASFTIIMYTKTNSERASKRAMWKTELNSEAKRGTHIHVYEHTPVLLRTFAYFSAFLWYLFAIRYSPHIMLLWFVIPTFLLVFEYNKRIERRQRAKKWKTLKYVYRFWAAATLTTWNHITWAAIIKPCEL